MHLLLLESLVFLHSCAPIHRLHQSPLVYLVTPGPSHLLLLFPLVSLEFQLLLVLQLLLLSLAHLVFPVFLVILWACCSYRPLNALYPLRTLWTRCSNWPLNTLYSLAGPEVPLGLLLLWNSLLYPLDSSWTLWPSLDLCHLAPWIPCAPCSSCSPCRPWIPLRTLWALEFLWAGHLCRLVGLESLRPDLQWPRYSLNSFKS